MRNLITIDALTQTREWRAGGWPFRLSGPYEQIEGLHPDGSPGWFLPSLRCASRFVHVYADAFGDALALVKVAECWFAFAPASDLLETERVAFPAVLPEDDTELMFAIRTWIDALAGSVGGVPASHRRAQRTPDASRTAPPTSGTNAHRLPPIRRR